MSSKKRGHIVTKKQREGGNASGPLQKHEVLSNVDNYDHRVEMSDEIRRNFSEDLMNIESFEEESNDSDDGLLEDEEVADSNEV